MKIFSLSSCHPTFLRSGLLIGLCLAWFDPIFEPKTCYSQSTPTPKNAEAESLETKQRQLVQRFQKLEELFLRMSELEAVSNPTHAGLLMNAAQLSKQLGTRQRLNSAGELIAKGQISRAIQEQEAAHENLKKLLELL